MELARRILREMEAAKTVGVKEVWVPNRYVVRLSEEDREHFTSVEGSLARELEQVVMDGARERGFGLVARPEVVFETDDGLKRGSFRVDSELTERTGTRAAPGRRRDGDTASMPSSAEAAVLALMENGERVREYRLGSDAMVLGRLAGSDVEIADPGASRRHAEIRLDGDDYVLEDLNSTNGTLVNDSQVSRHVLRTGDRITIGRTVLEFRRP